MPIHYFQVTGVGASLDWTLAATADERGATFISVLRTVRIAPIESLRQD